ncbi:hypothetical protein BJV74DRAFT_800271, partial [Russula compacta]
ARICGLESPSLPSLAHILSHLGIPETLAKPSGQPSESGLVWLTSSLKSEPAHHPQALKEEQELRNTIRRHHGRGDVVSPHGIPVDLLDRCMIVKTGGYTRDQVGKVVQVRATVEGEKSSLRYALQLLTPASILARLVGRTQIELEDTGEMMELFLDAKMSRSGLGKGGTTTCCRHGLKARCASWYCLGERGLTVNTIPLCPRKRRRTERNYGTGEAFRISLSGTSRVGNGTFLSPGNFSNEAVRCSGNYVRHRLSFNNEQIIRFVRNFYHSQPQQQ